MGTRVDHADGYLWCSTTSNYDKDEQFGLCPSEELFTYGGNSKGKPCVFPFKANGTWFEKCTTQGKPDKYRWCATSDDFDEDGQWGYCPDRLSSTEGGSANGDYCNFPFIYNLLHVAVHEIGHILGLRHSSPQKAVMYGNYQYQPQFELNRDDVKEVLKLYKKRRSLPAPLVLEKCYRKYEEIDGQGYFRPEKKLDLKSLKTIDSIFTYGSEICVVKGEKVWRTSYRYSGDIWYNIPASDLSELWRGAPDKIDAAVRLETTGDFWLFQGQRYWRFLNSYQLIGGFPRVLEDFGFPRKVFRVDAALVRRKFEREKFIYLFSGTHYYTYDVELKVLGWARKVSDWDRRLTYIDGAIEHPFNKDITLFFKKKLVYVYHNKRRKVIMMHRVSDWLRLPLLLCNRCVGDGKHHLFFVFNTN